MSEAASLPIGVFDSGLGGLTVVRELVRRLPNESIVYFGDTARVPYGPKSADTVQRYANEAAAFLQEQGIKLLVIACNTATAHAFTKLSASLEIPVVGVIEPGARAAVAATRTKRIAVIGTAGTIHSGAYDYTIRRLLPDARVYAQPCPLFVPIVEEGFNQHEVARLAAREYLAPLTQLNVDVLVLGCTHYPLLHDVIREVMGPDVTLVDSAAETARDVETLLRERAVFNTTAPVRHRFFSSDSPMRFREVAHRFVGDLVTEVERVNVEHHG